MIETQVLMTFSDFSEFFLRIISSGGGFTFHWVCFFQLEKCPMRGASFLMGGGEEKPCFGNPALYVSNKLIFERLPSTVWSTFSSFLIFCCYCTRLNVREISRQNLRNSENIWSYCIRNRAITKAHRLNEKISAI